MASSASSSWSDLLPDLLGVVLLRLPSPADRARFRAVCRGWHSAARHHVRQLPWIVFPDGSYGTIEQRSDGYYSSGADIIPGLPDNVTCLGAAAIGWLALDCTDDVLRRTNLRDKFFNNRFLQPRRDVKHRHNYRLYNPFTGETVLLPKLDSLIGEVAETFDIRKVLMRRPSSDSPDDQLVAITTNSYNYSIIICWPGKGICCWFDNICVIDVAFHGGKLYGITPEEALVVLDLVEDDEGTPIISKCKFRQVIKKPLVDGEEDHHDDDEVEEEDDEEDNINGDDNDFNGDNINDDDDDDGGDGGGDNINDDDNDFNGDNINDDDNDSNDDGLVPSGEDKTRVDDWKMSYDIATTTRRLVHSSRGDGDDGELLMVRHHMESSPEIGTYTLDVDILKADMEAGIWVPVSELAEGEALFLSRSFSECIRAYGDIKEGFVYSTDVDEVLDIKSRYWSLIGFPREWEEVDHEFVTWLFPPEVQL